MTTDHSSHQNGGSGNNALDVAGLERPLFANYKRAPIGFVRGDGCRLFDTDGKEYLDFLAGIATSSLGHGHPGLVAAIQQQAARVLHVSNLFQIPEQSAAARRLCAASSGQFQRAFFCNSGAEAVEAAIKLARLAGHPHGRSKIVTAEGAFHGRTLGALAATGTPAQVLARLDDALVELSHAGQGRWVTGRQGARGRGQGLGLRVVLVGAR